MFGKKAGSTSSPGYAAYATSADFCRIFNRDMNRLYTLSLLLTADQSLAEKCFVAGLDGARDGTPVFKEWAESWARRLIIQKAIQAMRPRPTRAAVSDRNENRAAEPAELASILDLPEFERFVFVMSVLESYSEQECSLLLNCTRSDVVWARTQAIRRVYLSKNQRQPRNLEQEHEPKMRTVEHDRNVPFAFVRLAPSA